jgi:hypothetical protein
MHSNTDMLHVESENSLDMTTLPYCLNRIQNLKLLVYSRLPNLSNPRTLPLRGRYPPWLVDHQSSGSADPISAQHGRNS